MRKFLVPFFGARFFYELNLNVNDRYYQHTGNSGLSRID